MVSGVCDPFSVHTDHTYRINQSVSSKISNGKKRGRNHQPPRTAHAPSPRRSFHFRKSVHIHIINSVPPPNPCTCPSSSDRRVVSCRQNQLHPMHHTYNTPTPHPLQLSITTPLPQTCQSPPRPCTKRWPRGSGPAPGSTQFCCAGGACGGGPVLKYDFIHTTRTQH